MEKNATIKKLPNERLNEINFTSFFCDTLLATRNDLIGLFGNPQYNIPDNTEKVQYTWDMEYIIDGKSHIFTIYDWKEYSYFGKNTPIHWHIGLKQDHPKDLGKDITSTIKEMIKAKK